MQEYGKINMTYHAFMRKADGQTGLSSISGSFRSLNFCEDGKYNAISMSISVSDAHKISVQKFIYQMVGSWITNGEEECVYVIGGKARGKETTRKTKT
jgi:hypothetical protein